MSDPLVVLHEDAHLLAAFKPSGRLTQGIPSREPTLEDQVREYLGFPTFLGTIHRLDRPVSGVVIWAKSIKAARRLSAAFQSRGVIKEYWAIVDAGPDRRPEGLWESWLTRSTNASGRIESVSSDFKSARWAVTRWELGKAKLPEKGEWLILHPETGRTHQLRVHASQNGSPIWGDSLYGSRRDFPQGIALHCRKMTFTHPLRKEAISISAEPPISWELVGFERPGE